MQPVILQELALYSLRMVFVFTDSLQCIGRTRVCEFPPKLGRRHLFLVEYRRSKTNFACNDPCALRRRLLSWVFVLLPSYFCNRIALCPTFPSSGRTYTPQTVRIQPLGPQPRFRGPVFLTLSTTLPPTPWAHHQVKYATVCAAFYGVLVCRSAPGVGSRSRVRNTEHVGWEGTWC